MSIIERAQSRPLSLLGDTGMSLVYCRKWLRTAEVRGPPLLGFPPGVAALAWELGERVAHAHLPAAVALTHVLLARIHVLLHGDQRLAAAERRKRKPPSTYVRLQKGKTRKSGLVAHLKQNKTKEQIKNISAQLLFMKVQTWSVGAELAMVVTDKSDVDKRKVSCWTI